MYKTSDIYHLLLGMLRIKRYKEAAMEVSESINVQTGVLFICHASSL